MFLFFDTETTGIKRYQDHLVQLAWFLVDSDGDVLSENEWIVKPRGYTIPNRAEQVHGISTSHARLHGIELEEVLNLFAEDAKQSQFIVAHNISFDCGILETAYASCKLKSPLGGLHRIDTMTLSTDWCQLPKLNGWSGFKRPSLEELHFRLFGRGFDNAHTAMADTQAVMDCFYGLIEEGVIQIPDVNRDTNNVDGRKSIKRDKTSEKPDLDDLTTSDVLRVLTNSKDVKDRAFVAQHRSLSSDLLLKLIRDDEVEVKLEIAKRVVLTQHSFRLLTDSEELDDEPWLNLDARLNFKNIPITTSAQAHEKFLLELELYFQGLEYDEEIVSEFALSFLKNKFVPQDVKNVILHSTIIYDVEKREKFEDLIDNSQTLIINDYHKFLWQRLKYISIHKEGFIVNRDLFYIPLDPFLTKEMIFYYLDLDLVNYDEIDGEDFQNWIIPNILNSKCFDGAVLDKTLHKIRSLFKVYGEDWYWYLFFDISKHQLVTEDMMIQLCCKNIFPEDGFDWINSINIYNFFYNYDIDGNLLDAILKGYLDCEKIKKFLEYGVQGKLNSDVIEAILSVILESVWIDEIILGELLLTLDNYRYDEGHYEEEDETDCIIGLFKEVLDHPLATDFLVNAFLRKGILSEEVISSTGRYVKIDDLYVSREDTLKTKKWTEEFDARLTVEETQVRNS